MNIIMGDDSFVNVVLSAVAGAIVTACTTTEKSVKLLEAEVDNMSLGQQTRMDEARAERKEKREKLGLPPLEEDQDPKSTD